jgi:hypothetical protein
MTIHPFARLAILGKHRLYPPIARRSAIVGDA